MKLTPKKLAASIGGLLLLAAVFILVGRNTEQRPTSGSSQLQVSQPLISAAATSETSGATNGRAPENAAAWLTYPGTDIDGAVMQADDNNYYLRRNEAGEADEWGCYYLDFECSPTSHNIIVYGHSDGDNPEGLRFSQLKKLAQPDFAEENNIVELTIGGETRRYQIFSSGLASDLTDHIAITANPDPETMQSVIDMALARSQHDYGVEVGPEDSILTLSTCTSDENMRYVVVGRLVVEKI